MTVQHPTAAEQAAMERAFELALQGPRGINPQVGAVVLSPAGEVLAEGWHLGVGTSHAEADALSKLAPGAARGSTVVVSLEPCNHTGHTGPCSRALIAAGVARVVYAASDPGGISAGGAQALRDAGITVLQARTDEGEALIRDWLFVRTHGRPRVTLKWAQSLDGRAAAADGTSQWITGPEARAHVHAQRAAHDAIAVGTGTVIADDPALTARDEAGDLLPEQPIPVVVGAREIPETARLRKHPRFAELQRSRGSLAEALGNLAASGIQSLYVEGGPTLASAYIREGLVDEVHCYVAPSILGADRLALQDAGVATLADRIPLRFTAVERLGDDLFLRAKVVR